MDIYGWDPTEAALHAYVGTIAEYFGVPPEHTTCEVGDLAGAYIGFDESVPEFPHRDLALVWDERLGWAAAVEIASSEELIAFSYLGVSAVPHVDVVTSFVTELMAGRDRGQSRPPFFDRCDDLLDKLTTATRNTTPPTSPRPHASTR